VEEVKMIAAVVIGSIALPISGACELINPPPTKVRQVCGTVIYPNANITLRRSEGASVPSNTTADDKGIFNFGPLKPGLYRLSWTYKDEHGVTQEPALENSWPVRVSHPLSSRNCKKPLDIGILQHSGWESGISVSFLKVR
jgi:hypothetical protein